MSTRRGLLLVVALLPAGGAYAFEGDDRSGALLQAAPEGGARPPANPQPGSDEPLPGARYVDWARWAWERARTQADESPEVVLPSLLERISKGNGDRGVILAELTLSGLPTVPRAPLLEGLRDEDERVRGFCIRALGRLAPENAGQQTLILKAAAKDPMAWKAVGPWAGKDEQALKLMATALASPNLEVRVQTARMIQRIGRVKAPRGPPAYWAKQVGAALYKNAKHKDNRVSAAAANAPTRIGAFITSLPITPGT